MRVLVVGSNGFLGNAIAQAFLDHHAEVWGAYNKSSKNIPDKCQKVNINDIEKLKNNFDAVVLAAGNYALNNKELIDINVHLTQRLSNHFTDAKLIFISSVSVYGTHEDHIQEYSSFNDPSFYGLSKLSGESIVRTHNRYAILRLSYLYGIGMPDNSFLPVIIKNACKDKRVVLFGQGERLQDYLHIQDAAELCVLASMRDENDIYLGATGDSISNLDITKMIQKFIPDLSIELMGVDHAPWFQFTPSLTKNKLKWDTKHNLSDSLKQMVDICV